MGFDNPQTEALVLELNGQLEAARTAYYVNAAPIMTDEEYDTLEAKLRAVIKTSPWFAELATALTTVGSDATTGSRIQHVRPMLSIENQYTKEDVVKFVAGLPNDAAVCVEPKRDGISCELRYVNGHLKAAITRGTGVEGEDMTAQVKALKDVPQFLPTKALLELAATIHVRGELVMRDGELDRINVDATAKGQKTYASTRNLTAGTMKQKDLNIVANRQILFLPWDVYSPEADGLLPDCNFDRMQLLERAGFPTYAGYKVTGGVNPNIIIDAIDAILDYNAKNDIRADGVVIKVDSHKLRKELGVASKFTNWMTCFKPQSASGTTYLRNIIWQIGRMGALTPVAECDPVVLAGAVVTRATLNNETWIATMGLKLGAKVEMLRSGDVIPQIVKVLDDTGTDIELPTHCPECSKPITVFTDPKSKITTRFCENGECPGRVVGLFAYIGGRDILEIDGLAEDMATRIIKAGFARNIGELFEFQVEALDSLKKLQDKLGEEPGETEFLLRMSKQGFNVTVLKMLRSMEKAKTAPWNKWISALGIPMVGRTLGKLLAKEMRLESEDMPNLCFALDSATKRSIEGLGDVRSDILKNWTLDPTNRDICAKLYASGVRPTATVVKAADGVGQPLAGVNFIITGEFDFIDRTKLERTFETLGGTLKSGVSKNLTHFIVADNPGKSKLSKYDDLTAKGAKIEKVGKDWVLKVLEDAGVIVNAGGGFEVEGV
jgi:DNA ligase (NAD+)